MPSRFTCPVYTADVGRISYNRPVRVLTKMFDYYVGEPNSGNVITVPAGYCSDGASVPRLLYFVISPWGKYAQAAILHDLLYSTQKLYGEKRRTRKECDLIFRMAIKDIGRNLDEDDTQNSYSKRGTISAWFGWAAVRAFGYFSYRDGPKNYGERAEKVHARALKKQQAELANQIILKACDLPENLNL